MMFIVRDPETGEVQHVAALEGYEAFEQLGEEPEEFDPLVHVWSDEAGGIVTDLSSLIVHLHTRIDAEAGACRCRFITDVPGQEQTYDVKLREARAFVEAEAPDPADYPLLAAEARYCPPMTVADVADLVLATAETWLRVNAEIEGARRGAKVAVSAATTRAEAEAAAAVDWDAVVAAVTAEGGQ